MKIAFVTAGTGAFYCGACLRDAALARGLRAMGHDAFVIPLYLPTVEEGEKEADGEIFMGGLNAYLQQKLSVFRKTPRFVDKLLDSPWLLKGLARLSGMTSASDLGQMTFATLEGTHGTQRKEIDRLLEHLAAEQPDVLVLSNVLLCGFAPAAKQRLGIPVICTMQGEDTFLDELPEPWREKSWAQLKALVADIDLFIGVSRYYGELMQGRMGIPDAKLSVVYNGIDLTGYAEHERKAPVPTVGYLSQLIRNKGLDTLVEAFILLKQRSRVPDLRLEIAGSTVPGGGSFLRQIHERLEAAGVADDVRIRENVSREEKIAHYHATTVFSAPATYGESFGLYVVEAMAAGTPVVQPRHAAFPELIEMTGGGLLSEPNSAESLADALEELLLDPERAAAMGASGKAAVEREFSAAAMARNFEDALNSVI